ncbi:unnamed protein product [Microthlaspi erraticum]|uniref:Uncharacterized protein n=1 Tax=Microthlaspi erraticum TaxID=1685480 RepID=A0A6D2JFB7_9BRAS|nr:unnamed protein product [Microthlaspi erraticum]CAA7044370.1 unnamed protein product [Microthlaspi erraticum]CAA7051246.1 unnamed protein product [Microthlaspi erraticum]CAA7061269.1 unnamed protein product [Microthlaspi erraticum]
MVDVGGYSSLPLRNSNGQASLALPPPLPWLLTNLAILAITDLLSSKDWVKTIINPPRRMSYVVRSRLPVKRRLKLDPSAKLYFPCELLESHHH